MDSAVLLDIAAICYDDASPVTADCGTRTDINIFPYDDPPSDSSQGVDKGRRIDNRGEIAKTVDHEKGLISSKGSLQQLKAINTVAHLVVAHLGVPHCQKPLLTD